MNWEKIIGRQKEIINKKINKGIALFDQGKFKEALPIFLGLAEEGLIRRSPQVMISILTNLGRIYLKLQDYQKSIDYYLEAIKKTKGHPLLQEKKEKIKREMAFSLILKLAIAGKPKSALGLCDYRLNKDPGETFLIETKGDLLNNLGQYEESIFCFEEMLEKIEKSREKSQLFYKIGLNYFRLNEFEKAQEYFKEGEKENSQNYLNFLGLAQIAWEEKDWPTVIGFLEKAEKLAPTDISFLPDLIEAYCQCDLTKKAIPKIQKISKSKDTAVMAQFLNLIMRIKDMKFKEYLFRKAIQICWKNEVFRKELRNALERSSDWRLMGILKNIREEMKGQSKNGSVLVNLLKEGENLIIKKHRLIEEYFTLIGWLIPEEEIKEFLNQYIVEEIEKILESAFIEKFKNRYQINQEGWREGFVNKIKEGKSEIFSSLKEIADFLEGLENFDKTTVVTVVFDSRQKGGMVIEEQTNQLTFRILPDFPAKLKSEELILLLDFYKKRVELWRNLADLIMEGKIIPPHYASIEQWAEKNTERLPNNQILLEELQQEGNNLKMDLILQKLETEIHQRAYPIVSQLLKNKSPVLAARFNQKGGKNNCSSLALEYFKYIRRGMKVK